MRDAAAVSRGHRCGSRRHSAGSIGVVNSAGVFRFESLLDITEAAWDRTIDVNLKGTFLVCQAAIPHLRAAGGGRIVNVSSVAGVRGGPRSADYIASKWGVVGLTKAIAAEFGPDGIVANAVAPATIPDTPMGRRSLDQKVEMGWGADVDETLANQARNYPLRRLGTADDVARTICFLLSEDAAWMSGQVVGVDGGATASSWSPSRSRWVPGASAPPARQWLRRREGRSLSDAMPGMGSSRRSTDRLDTARPCVPELLLESVSCSVSGRRQDRRAIR